MPLRPSHPTSIVVPAFDEMARLPATLDLILALAGDGDEVLFVDDGSQDGTGDFLDAHATGDGVRVLHLAENRGKGAAVRAGVAAASGEAIVFIDADLSTDLDDLPAVVAALATHDVAIASRAIPGTSVARASWRRRALGAGFNGAVRALTGLPFRDTQCGCKAFRSGTAKQLFAMSTLDGWAFDVEILLLASRAGYRITEVPVRWREMDGTHVRPARDGAHMLVDVVRARRAVRLDGAADAVRATVETGTNG